MASAAKSPYAGYRFPGEVISHAVWLYFRFPLSLRMVEEMLAARGIEVSHETVRQWARKFGQGFANQIRHKLPDPGDTWHLDKVCLMIRGKKHWLWRAVDQDGIVLDVLVQSRRDKQAGACKLVGAITPLLLLPCGHHSRAGSPDSVAGRRPRACRSARPCARPGRAAPSLCSSASAAPWSCAWPRSR